MVSKRPGKTVRLTVLDNEPMARLAEQRLRQEAIGCLVRALGAGPGGWGTSAYLPHAIYVSQADEMRARQVLDLAPQEIVEREPQEVIAGYRWRLGFLILLLLAAAVVLTSIGLSQQGLLP